MKRNSVKIGMFSLLLFCLPMLVFSAADGNVVDEDGNRQGYWVITGKMTTLKGYGPEDKVEEGEYKDNKKMGLWKKYWPNGNQKSEVTYKMGKPEGTYKVYYRNGQLQEEGSWQNDVNVGAFKRYYQNGKLQQEFYFLNTGKRNGEQKYYYENGKLELKANFTEGEEDGEVVAYNEDGTLREKKVMEKGQLKPGTLKTYSGAKKNNYVAVEDKEAEKTDDTTNKAYEFDPNGYNTLYNRDLQKTQVGLFKAGKLYDGKWYRYNDDGVLEKIEIYKEGKFVGNGVIEE